MPTYAYACRSCEHRFDAVQSFSEPTLTECPECGGVLRKEYGSIGVTFNGSGFYRTDSRAGEGKGGAKGSSGGGSGSSESGSSGSGSSGSGSSGSGSSGSSSGSSGSSSGSSGSGGSSAGASKSGASAS